MQTKEAPLSATELLALACSVGLVPLNSTMIAVAIPAMATDLAEAPGTLIQWLVTSYLLVNIVAQSPAGKLGDRWGHARALRLGQVIFTVGSVLGYLSHTLTLLTAARLLMALGGAIMVPASVATVRIFLPAAQQARAFGMFGAVMGLSAAIGPLVGGEVAHRFGWPALFLVNVVPLAVVGGLAVLGLRSSGRAAPAPRASRFDILGSVLLGVGLTLIVLGTRNAEIRPMLVGMGLGVLLAFAWWEQRAADPVIDLRLFTRRAFATGSCIVSLQNFAMYALLFELPLVFSHGFGASSALTGRALLAMTLAMVAGSVIGGRFADHFGLRKASTIGAAVAFGGGILLMVFPITSVLGSVPALVTLGLGLGLSTPAANAALMSAALAGESGMASAVSGTMRYLGGIAGVAMVSAMVAGDGLLAAHQRSTLIFSVVLGIALILARLIPERPPHPPQS